MALVLDSSVTLPQRRMDAIIGHMIRCALLIAKLVLNCIRMDAIIGHMIRCVLLIAKLVLDRIPSQVMNMAETDVEDCTGAKKVFIDELLLGR